jgi:hypothetical protein
VRRISIGWTNKSDGKAMWQKRRQKIKVQKGYKKQGNKLFS